LLGVAAGFQAELFVAVDVDVEVEVVAAGRIAIPVRHWELH
jgi:hypothetical protein